MQFEEIKITLKGGIQATLREAEETDAAELIEFMRKTTEETHFLSRYPEEITISLEGEEEILREILQSPTRAMIVAVIDGKIIGSAGVNVVAPHMKMQHRAMFGVSILESHWNLGVGSALITKAISLAADMGCSQIELGVFADNESARALYRRMGFEEWGMWKDAFRLKDGTYRDEILMGRKI